METQKPATLTATSLPAVSGVTATLFAYAAATISWRAVNNALSYQVQYSERAQVPVWHNAPLVPAPNTHTTLTGLKMGTTYDFRVFAN